MYLWAGRRPESMERQRGALETATTDAETLAPVVHQKKRQRGALETAT